MFFHVILPLSQPGLATAGTLTLLGAWNEFVYANVLMSITARKTLTQGIAAMQGQYFTNYGMMAAGLMAAIIPVTIIYIAFQENVIRGMSAGAHQGMSEIRSVEQWGVFDLEVRAAKLPDNPFTDAHVAATFTQGTRVVAVDGFYDGDGVYGCVFSRFPGHVALRDSRHAFRARRQSGILGMRTGEWANSPDRSARKGIISATRTAPLPAWEPPRMPGRTRMKPGWNSTLESFGNYRFNKIRMLVFPKEYGTDTDLFRIDGSPAVLPFEGKPRALDFPGPIPSIPTLRAPHRAVAGQGRRG